MQEAEIFRDNPPHSRFELEVDGRRAVADYRREPGLLHILYVEAPPELRGTGAASRLMQAIAEQAKAEGSRIVPVCSYAAAWLQRHAEWRELVQAA